MMKKKILALAIGSILSAGVQAALTDIVITEYVEGSSYNKAIELTNFGDDDFTFPSNIGITKQTNGTKGSWSTLENLEGIKILAGQTLVLVDKNTKSAAVRAAVTENGGTPVISGTFGNGDDVHALADITVPGSPILLDVVGVVDGGKGKKWGEDITLRRRLLTGDNNPIHKVKYDVKEWEELDKDDFTGLAKNELASAPVAFTCTDANPKTAIEDIQGDSWKSPLITSGYESADSYYVEGVVTAVTSLPRIGLYLQGTDSSENYSNGIFVETSAATDDLVGKTICVSSKIYEDYNFTKLKTNNFVVTDTATTVPAAVDITILEADGTDFQKTLERYEGMLVKFPDDMDSNVDGNQTMRVSRTFSRDFGARRDNISLAYKRPNMQPNQEHPAGSKDANAQKAENKNFRVLLESNTQASSGAIPYFPTYIDNPNLNYIRVNDSVVGIEGVLSHSYGNFSVTVTNEATADNFKHNTPRTDKPALDTTTTVGSFPITIATQNVLNLFTTSISGDENPTGQNRGAKSELEYDRQLAKITKAILALDTDIIGLMEIENNGFGDNGALHALVESINADIDGVNNHYVFVGIDSNKDGTLDKADTIGTDAITTGLLYRPSKVTLAKSGIIKMPQQHADPVTKDGKEVESGDNYQRDSLVATFIINQTGKKLNVAVNHFKSKGSTCVDDFDDKGTKVDADQQGSCENFRISAAYQLGTEFSKLEGDSVILGDLNAYGSEDPLLVLTSNPTNKVLTSAIKTYIGGTADELGTAQRHKSGAEAPFTVAPADSFGYINIVDKMDTENGKVGWSYSYNDEIGSLDHMLVNESLEKRVIDAGDWHINSTESTYFQYETKYSGKNADAFYGASVSPFRSSDHDPAMMSLSYKYGEADAGQAVVLPIIDNTINLTYAVPNGIATKKGDIATVTLTPKASIRTLSGIAVQDENALRFVLENDNQAIVPMEIKGIQSGDYTIKIQLLRMKGLHEVALPNSDVNMDITVAQSALPEVDVVPPTPPTPPENKKSGGSFGIFGIMSLLGLSLLRRNTK